MKIKSSLTKLAAITTMVFSMTTVTALAATAASDHDHGHEVTELKLNNGSKWAIDAPLSRAMTNIRNAMYNEIDLIHSNGLPKEKYLVLSKEINNEVKYMVENCKLEPEADAQLHLIIQDLVEGSSVMETNANAQDGAVKVIGAIEKYTTYFDDPGFKPLAH